MKFLVAALSLWEGGNIGLNPEYARAQAETLARILQGEGFTLDSGDLVATFDRLATRVCAGESPAHAAADFFRTFRTSFGI